MVLAGFCGGFLGFWRVFVGVSWGFSGFLLGFLRVLAGFCGGFLGF